MHIIEFSTYCAYYKTKSGMIKALDKLSFSIDTGEIFVVVGESGSGKTTLLKSVLGQCEYTEGDLFIDGMSVDDLSVSARNIGYVRQEADLYPHMTVYENIAFPLRIIHTAQTEIDRRVKEIADLLEIPWLLTRKPRQLSGGEQQRVAIARALVKQPELILFDEPFSNIEPNLRAEFRALLRKIHQALNPTILFVTHDLGEAFSLADHLLVLENGSIADFGTPTELLQQHHSVLLKGYLK